MYLGDNADSVFKVDCNHLYFLELGARLFKMIGREELIEEMKDNSFFAEKKNEEMPVKTSIKLQQLQTNCRSKINNTCLQFHQRRITNRAE